MAATKGKVFQHLVNFLKNLKEKECVGIYLDIRYFVYRPSPKRQECHQGLILGQ